MVTGNCNLQCFVVMFSCSNQCKSCLLPAVTRELLFTAVWPRGSVHSAFRALFLFPPVCLGRSRGSVIPGAGTAFPCWCFGRAKWTAARRRGREGCVRLQLQPSAEAPAQRVPFTAVPPPWEENRGRGERQAWRSTARGRAWSRSTVATCQCRPSATASLQPLPV